MLYKTTVLCTSKTSVSSNPKKDCSSLKKTKETWEWNAAHVLWLGHYEGNWQDLNMVCGLDNRFVSSVNNLILSCALKENVFVFRKYILKLEGLMFATYCQWLGMRGICMCICVYAHIISYAHILKKARESGKWEPQPWQHVDIWVGKSGWWI